MRKEYKCLSAGRKRKVYLEDLETKGQDKVKVFVKLKVCQKILWMNIISMERAADAVYHSGGSSQEAANFEATPGVRVQEEAKWSEK